VRSRTKRPVDREFVPRPFSDIASVAVDDEVVLARPGGHGAPTRVHVLSGTAPVVWQCFDGVSTVGELVEDVAVAFGADRKAVEGDILDLVQRLGAGGLLQGITEVTTPSPSPLGLAIGSEVPCSGTPPTSRLFIHWDWTCRYCEQLGETLSEAAQSLDNAQVLLVLVTPSLPNRKPAARLTLVSRYVVITSDDDCPIFLGLGTPCAYCVDNCNRVASRLAIGASEVAHLVSIATEIASC